MARQRDPVEAHSDGDEDLYDVADWEPRTALDRLAVAVHAGVLTGARALLILAAIVILGAQVLLGGFGAVTDPVIGAFVLLSAVPALLLAAYVWHADVTTAEPLSLLVITFVLGVLFAGFAGVLNTFVGGPIVAVAAQVGIAPILGSALVFYFVVGPVEESVKLLAVRLSAYRDERFDAVIDGAVYGAVAGLGFATIENALYIGENVSGLAAGEPVFQAAGGIAFLRGLVGPGHVLFSAFAGYYLGLAKFNPENAGPIVAKGLLVAAIVHATYNTLAGIAPVAIADVLGVGPVLGFLAFVLVYDGLFGLAVLAKLRRYRGAYRNAGAGDSQADAATDADGYESEPTEFDA